MVVLWLVQRSAWRRAEITSWTSCADGQPGTVLVPLMALLVRRLVMDDVPRGMVERSGSALLPLIIAEPAGFQHLGG